MSSLDSIGIGPILYLTAAPNLAPGSELASGHWSGELSGWALARSDAKGCLDLTQEAHHVLLELTWEMVRLREFSHRPSHLDALFLWPDEGAARAWHYRKHHLNGSGAGLYEVTVSGCERAFAADMNLISYLEPGDTLAMLVERARRYWRGEIGEVPPEVLLEGRIVVRRDLLALAPEMLMPMTGQKLDEGVRTALQWEAAPAECWRLTPVSERRQHLEGSLTVDRSLPIGVAGWTTLEVEGRQELVQARRGTPPLLLRPGDTSRISVGVADLPALPDSARWRPVLLCDREAACYWQLQPFWEGRVLGSWQTT